MQSVLDKLGIAEENPGVFDGEWRGGGGKIDKVSPIDGRKLASVRSGSEEDYQKAIARAQEAFLRWRTTPGPVRGDTVRRLGNALRELKGELGQLVTLETGKIIAEGEGEVQEMIDICDLAVGQSRMLYGLTIQSERPSHRLMEQWHPLGDDPIGAAESSADGTMAPARRCCSDHRVQFSRSGLVMECRARRSLRRRDGLEAIGKNATYRNCGHKNRGARLPRDGRGPGDFHFADRRPQDGWPKTSGRRADPISLGDRLGEHGFERRENSARPLRQNDHGTWRQQRAHRRAKCRHRHGDAIDLLRRSGHGRTALHIHAARRHARVGCFESPQ